MKKTDVYMTVRMPRPLDRKIAQEAEATSRTKAGLIRFILQKHFNDQEEE